MLSVPTYKLPRKVYIKVAKAEKLSPSTKDNKKKLNNKYRVVIIGGKTKESSVLVEDDKGNPEWSFNCIIKLHRGSPDPLCILIEDSEGHHKGQVVIPLVKIGPKPYTHTPDQSPATSTNLICSELEPTKKCPVASGYLIYWIWVEEYFADGDTDSRRSFNKSLHSLFGSKNALSKPSGSIGNVSSNSSLNKPEKHKGGLHFIKPKSSKKDKSKLSGSDCNLGDIDSNMGSGIIFDANKSSVNNKNLSYGSNDLQFGAHTSPMHGSDERSFSFKIPNTLPDRLDVLSHGSNGSISERTSKMRYGEEFPGAIRQNNGTLPSSMIGKFNNQDPYPHRDIDQRYQPGHVSMSSSDFSLISDRSGNQPISTTVKNMNEEADILRRENSDLRSQNNLISLKMSQLQNELDEVKNTLYKLRNRLLEEGATKFLEKK